MSFEIAGVILIHVGGYGALHSTSYPMSVISSIYWRSHNPCIQLAPGVALPLTGLNHADKPKLTAGCVFNGVFFLHGEHGTAWPS
jgi:hypothetical protein